MSVEDDLKRLEGRIAELHDRLNTLQISDDEWKTFFKIAALMRAGVVKGPKPSCEEAGKAAHPTIVVACFVNCQQSYGIKKPCCYMGIPNCFIASGSWGGPAGFGAEFGDFGY
jgi:hypothetical protein